jgi:hypothetical protein
MDVCDTCVSALRSDAFLSVSGLGGLPRVRTVKSLT